MLLIKDLETAILQELPRLNDYYSEYYAVIISAICCNSGNSGPKRREMTHRRANQSISMPHIFRKILLHILLRQFYLMYLSVSFLDIRHSGWSRTKCDGTRSTLEMGPTIDGPISRSTSDRFHLFLEGRSGFQRSAPQEPARSGRLEIRAFKPAARTAR